METREYRRTDRAACRRIYREAREQTFTWFDSGSFADDDFDRDTEGELIWVACEDGKVVGFVSAWKPESFIHNLFVDPARRRRGIGTTLLETALAHLGRPASLKCQARNTTAHRFYLSRSWSVAEMGTSPEGDYFLMQLPAPDAGQSDQDSNH